jgi:hypothetical protein
MVRMETVLRTNDMRIFPMHLFRIYISLILWKIKLSTNVKSFQTNWHKENQIRTLPLKMTLLTVVRFRDKLNYSVLLFKNIIYSGILSMSLMTASFALDWQSESYGQLTLVPMTTAPYPHESRLKGLTRDSTVYSFEEHYNNNTVAIIIPKNYRPTSKINVIVHFHGHMQDLDRVLHVYQLGEQLDASRKNAILVIPQGPVKVPDSQFGKLDTKDGFKNFMSEFIGLISQDKIINPKKRKLEIGEIILTAHSGGYYTVGQVLDQGGLTGKIKEVYLLDATYGQLEKYADWIKQYHGRFISIFTEHLANNNVDLMAQLEKLNIPYKLIREKEVTDKQLKQNSVLFLPTELEHDHVPYETHLVERLLKTGTLSSR